jgi:hypothetical protein
MMKRPTALRTTLLALGLGLAAASGAPYAQTPAAVNAITPGELVVDPPTLINLGFEWLVDGDANHTATVEVSYRKTGETAWRMALPMLRLDGERIKSGRQIDVVVPNMFGGSILDLQPDTSS